MNIASSVAKHVRQHFSSKMHCADALLDIQPMTKNEYDRLNLGMKSVTKPRDIYGNEIFESKLH